MTTDALVCNSPSIDVFDKIIHNPQGSLRAVEIAGRGISASARCTITATSGKAHPRDIPLDEALRTTEADVEQLMDLGVIEDDLVELWRRRCVDEVDDAEFEEALEQVVGRFEAWSRHWRDEFAGSADES